MALTATELTGTPDAMMKKAIAAQGIGDGQRAELSGGRVWLQKQGLHMMEARVFVPYAKGIVMGVAIIKDADKLGELAKTNTLVLAHAKGKGTEDWAVLAVSTNAKHDAAFVSAFVAAHRGR